MFAISYWHERISVIMHNIENRCVIGPENVLFCRLVRTLFSPEILQAVAVMGLKFTFIKSFLSVRKHFDINLPQS